MNGILIAMITRQYLDKIGRKIRRNTMLRKTLFLATIATLTLIFSSFLFAAGKWAISPVENRDVDFRAVYFVDARNGWAVGDSALDQTGMIAQTKNGGAKWTFYDASFDRALQDVFFISDKIGWAVGVGNAPIDESIIVATTNGGKTWKRQKSEVYNNLHGVFFVDKKLGWAVGMGETILLTTNGGKKWEILMGGQSTTAVGEGDIRLLGAHFMRKKVEDKEKIFGWVVGQNGVVLHTEDAGKKFLKPEDVWKTWQKQEVKDAEGVLIESNLNDVFFSDEQTGWIVGADGLILQTTDTGKTWQQVDIESEEELHSVYFAPKTQIGWAVGTYGTILYTSDNGKTWQKQSPPIHKVSQKSITFDLLSVCAFGPSDCWIAGKWGTILRYSK